jgi:UDPglucose--hexose-1-phosphate uridylyltransferase
MADFHFLEQDSTGRYVISAPRRAERPDAAHGSKALICPFCPGQETEEVYRVKSITSTTSTTGITSKNRNGSDSDWLVRVIPNKYPFVPIHEVIIHAPDHYKSFDELPLSHVELILQTYRQRFNTHRDRGNVYIFHNKGFAAGESITHSHTQLAVSPSDIPVNTPTMSAPV